MKKVLLTLIVALIATTSAFMGNITDEVKQDIEEYKQFYIAYTITLEINSLEQSPLTISNLNRYMELIEVENKDIVLRQIILESGWLKSGLTRKYNNLLGMKYANRRETLAIGKAMGHAAFAHWTDSVKDYVLWQKYWQNKGYDTKDYYAFLKKIGYAESKRYIQTLKSINLEKEVFRIQNFT